MRRSLETEEIAPLLNAPQTLAQDVQQRELHTVENLPARRTLTLAEQQAAQQSLVVTPEAQALALKREQVRKRGRAIETALNGDGGPYQQFGDVFETFAIALASGISESEALRRAARNAPEPMQRLFAEVAAQIERGVPLVQALRKHEEQLPDLVVPIFEHGTIYGTAENASRQLARALKHLARVEEKFLYSALDPGMVIPLVAGGILLLSVGPCFLMFANPLVPFLLICGLALSASLLGWKYRDKLTQWKSRRATAVAGSAVRHEGVCASAAGRGALVADVRGPMALRRSHQCRPRSGGAKHQQCAITSGYYARRRSLRAMAKP